MNWNGYVADIRESFTKLREEQKLFDVTLVTDDGQHIQAHKIILSAGSYFFSYIFMRSNHSNMLVYLKGISSDKLEPVIDFIYNGKIFLKQEELRAFIETGKELLVKGLESEMTEVVKSTNQISPHSEGDENEYEDLMCEKALKSNADDDKDTENITDEKNLQFRIDYEISLQLNEMTEKIEGVWICKVCGKTATQKGGIRRHAEAHIQGMSHACHICGKTFTTRPNLYGHVSGVHSELFSCEICGKTGINREAFRSHKRSKHN